MERALTASVPAPVPVPASETLTPRSHPETRVYGTTSGGNEFLTWHVFGDPSVLVRSKTPEVMAANHSGSMMIGLGQVSVTLKVDRRQYLEHEPVTAVVTITNRSGRQLDFSSRLEGKIAHSWLDFSMRDSSAREMSKRHHKVFNVP